MQSPAQAQLLAFLHARPAAKIAELALGHSGSVTVETVTGQKVDARSVLHLLALGEHGPQTLTLRADGEGAVELVNAMARVLLADPMPDPAEFERLHAEAFSFSTTA